MDIHQIKNALLNLNETPSLIMDIANGDVDYDSGLVAGDPDDAENFLMYLNDLALNASEDIDNWIESKSTGEDVLESLTDQLDEYNDYYSEIKIVSNLLQKEAGHLVTLVREGISFIRDNPKYVKEPDQKYYVYAHINPKTDEIFYIGKGEGQRAWSKNRESYWQEYVKSIGGGYTVKILLDKLTEVKALDYETESLLEYKDTVINKDMPIGIKIDFANFDA